MKHPTSYLLTTLLLYIIGFITLDWWWFVGGIVINLCAFYWVNKEGKKK